MIGKFLDTMIATSTDKRGNNDPSKSWKVLEIVASHFKYFRFLFQEQI